MPDLYEILGVEKTATIEEIKKAFKKLSKVYHPDMGGSAAKFVEINNAYKILSNKNRRKFYDETGHCERFDFKVKFNAIILPMIEGIIKSIDVQSQDFLKVLKDHIENTVIEIQKSKKQTRKLSNDISHVVKKISFREKDKENDLLNQALDIQLNQYQKSINSIEVELQFFKSMLDIIDKYRYEHSNKEREKEFIFEAFKNTTTENF